VRIISLGWGAQSVTIAGMAALGQMASVDVALFADTSHERVATYEFAREVMPWLESHGVKVVTVRAESTAPINRWGGMLLPGYTSRNGSVGQTKRQCTDDWKIAPIRRWLQAHREGRRVSLLLGISLDEIGRMRDSSVKYIAHEYPLVDRRMTRGACVSWLERQGLPVPERSACVMCPFQSERDWRSLSEPDRQHAIEVDEGIRMARPPQPLYVHRSLRPVAELDLRSEPERGQMSLWENECTGYCGT
jgi:hypothetical protein